LGVLLVINKNHDILISGRRVSHTIRQRLFLPQKVPSMAYSWYLWSHKYLGRLWYNKVDAIMVTYVIKWVFIVIIIIYVRIVKGNFIGGCIAHSKKSFM